MSKTLSQESASKKLGRRLFLKATAVAGASLTIGCYMPPPEPAPAPKPRDLAPTPAADPAPPSTAVFAPNAWVRVAGSGAVTIIVDKAEMGQGVETALPMLVAEELEADWTKIGIEWAPPDPVYVNPIFGMQATGGSTTIRGSWGPLRKAGATARMMLISAAAETWQVEPASCKAERGEIVHTESGRRLGFGALVEKAAKQAVPKDPPLKDAASFKLIGTRPTRLDAAEKAAGRPIFGIDVKRPGLLAAVVVRCPVFGGKVARFTPDKAMAVKGVRKVFAIGGGIAVVADAYWQARQGAKALEVEWDEGANKENSSAKIKAAAEALAKKPGKVAERKGDAEKALKAAARAQIQDAIYEAPFQSHAAMEPLNCTAEVRKDGADIWVGTQSVDFVRKAAAGVTGLPPASIKVHCTYLGGAFGRRFEQDFVIESVQISKEMGAPVKVTWSREDDLRHDFYRPGSYNVLRGAVGKDGMPVAWTHRIVGPSIFSRVFPRLLKDGLDPSSVEGAANLAYSTPNVLVDYHMQDTGVPVGFWRSVGHSQNAFVSESFLDELAALGKQDPFELRRKLLAGSPRLLAVLELAAAKAGWGKPLGPGIMGRGIAAHASFESFVAQVAEVSVGEDGRVKVHRVVCAIDCGQVVNPDIVEAQVEGAIVYGLTAAMKGEITIEAGRVKQSNFHDYRLLRMNEMPVVEVHIVPSRETPSGVGEPGTPPIAPAVTNAIFAATGKRIRRLPIRLADLKGAKPVNAKPTPAGAAPKKAP